MRPRPFTFVLAVALALLGARSPAMGGGSLPLTQIADLPLPGQATRFDYQAVDSTRRRLYIAHLGDGALVVFDLDGQRVVREIAGLPSVHGVALAPEQHLLLATATGEKTLALIDDQTFEVRARVPAGEYPNGLANDPASGRAFVSNKGIGVGVVDVRTSHALPGIDVGGGAGNTQYDAESGHVLAAVHGQPFLADVDPYASRVASRIALPGVSSCHGLLVASSPRLAFAVCHGAATPLIRSSLARDKTGTFAWTDTIPQNA